MLTCEPETPLRIGLVAGWGKFPVVVAEALRRSGHEIVCCGIKGHASSKLVDICHEFQWFPMAKMGAQVDFLRSRGVATATMAGKIFKTRLFEKNHWLRNLPDWTCIRHFYPLFVSGSKNRNDDTLLNTVIELYADNGIDFRPATDFAPQLLIKSGQLSGPAPNRKQRIDIEFGWNLARQMGRLDVGQSVAVKGQAVLAVEAIEGTDQCIRRAGELCTAGGFTVVKTAKPQQDMRFDVPTVGVSTIETMATSGGKVLAIEADRTIVLDQQQLITAANRHGICVVSLSHPELVRKSA